MRYFLILVGAAVVAYLLARGIAAVLSDRKRSKKERIEMKPADLQIVKAAKPRSLAVAIGTGLLFVLILFLAFGSWFQVDQGERGVVLRNGKLVRVAEPGLDFKTPFIDNVSVVSVRDHTFVFENLEAYSYDQQPATLRVSVTYRVPAERVAELYSEYGTINNLQGRVLERKTPDAVKRVRPLHRRALSRNARSWAWT